MKMQGSRTAALVEQIVEKCTFGGLVFMIKSVQNISFMPHFENGKGGKQDWKQVACIITL